ncbi:BLUF domain-containing protein [Catenovulum sp. SM1970]|uniref:BLUF domain-containing protein n=1 Tax=Marinifaba aquimaris TaxID=2741323 RepID=UPI0015716908|nr:BLUF domain-containing protein [Marinifaba aquimaris]NTS77033.1 BLUF domain-containing protein [Marinifaba aquimaris]
MSENLHRIGYISCSQLKSLCKDQQDKINESLSALVLNSKTKNSKNGVTGALLYNGDHFVQVLEGDKSYLEALYQKILVDSRHQDVRLLFKYPVKTRAFNAWAMELVHAPKPLPVSLSYLLKDQKPTASNAFADNTVALLKELLVDQRKIG